MLKFMQQVRLYARASPRTPKDILPITSSQVVNIEPKIERDGRDSKLKPDNESNIIDLTEETPGFSKSKELSAQLKQVLVSIKSRKKRDKHERVLLEGKRLIRDAVESGCLPETILFSRIEDMKSLSLPSKGVKIYKIPYKTISLWTDTATCPGVMGIFKTPPVADREPSPDALPLTVVCDNVREPGNLGAILRVAAGVGCEKLILTRGCVDLWEPKVLRSACGAHFRLPIHRNIEPSSLHTLIPSDAHVFLADNNTDDPSNSFHRFIPSLSYDCVDFTAPSHAVIVIGGETEGIGNDAMQLAASTNGARLRIPLGSGVESLNSGTALAVVLFEIRRQLTRYQEVVDDVSLSSTAGVDVSR